MSAVVLLALLGCDSVMRVTGTVRNSQGDPLEGVAVTLQSDGRGPHATATAKDGSFEVSMVGADAQGSRLVFTRTGYRTLEMPLLPLRDAQPVAVTLELQPAILPAPGTPP